VPLSLIVEQLAAKAGEDVSPMLRRMLELGIHPTDDARVSVIGKDNWQVLFGRKTQDGPLCWLSGGHQAHEFAESRNFIIQEQDPHIDEVLFSKSYFAMEETGLG